MSRTKLVAGNWKMNLTAAEAGAAVGTLLGQISPRPDIDVLVCPPFLSLSTVRGVLRNTALHLGAQDVFWKESGAFTGKVSPGMLVEAGCSHCLVGHSETRGRFGKLEVGESTLGYFNETDHTANLKIRALLYHAIVPILCVGETEDERTASKTESVIRKQLTGALEGIDPAELYSFVVAYEPVWAIGTGKTCDAVEAGRVCAEIRAMLGDILDKDVADHIRILYGGSVKSSNAQEIFSQPEVDGGLVGGASLDPLEFAKIVLSA